MNPIPLIIRAAVVCLGLTAASLATAGTPLVSTAQEIESRLNARVGIAVLDQETGRAWRHHADQRFPLASTFKVLACGALLHKVDAGDDRLDRMIHYGEADLVTYSPATGEHVDTGMTLGALCEAAITLSDNTAANLVLDAIDAIDGPAGLTRFLRGSGDNVTRLDRREPALNEATPGDPRDTTTPDAILETLRELLFGDTLTEPSRRQLLQWMKDDQVADALLRAGIPDDWTIGDKTGSGGHGSRAIIAVMWPPQRGPILAAIYITETDATLEQRNAAIADIGRALAAAMAR